MHFGFFAKPVKALGAALLGASRDLAPIIAVIALFQMLVLKQPFPELLSVCFGLVLVIIGLAFFVIGLDIGLFPLGVALAEEFAIKGSLFWLLLFAFALGFGTTVAEPALIAVTREGAKAAAEAGFIDRSAEAIGRYARGAVRRCRHRHRRAENPQGVVAAGAHRRRVCHRDGHDAVCPERNCRAGL